MRWWWRCGWCSSSGSDDNRDSDVFVPFPSSEEAGVLIADSEEEEAKEEEDAVPTVVRMGLDRNRCILGFDDVDTHDGDVRGNASMVVTDEHDNPKTTCTNKTARDSERDGIIVREGGFWLFRRCCRGCCRGRLVRVVVLLVRDIICLECLCVCFHEIGTSTCLLYS
jgi:hypothetical protein